MGEHLTLNDLIKAANEQFDRAELLGEVDRREAANDATFVNALSWIERLGAIQRDPKPGGKEVSFVKTAKFEDLVALRDRLASALFAG